MEVSVPGVDPRIYRNSLAWRALAVALGAIFAIGLVAGMPFLWRQADREHPVVLVMIAIYAFVFALSGCAIFNILWSRLLLFPNRIEIRGLFLTRVLARDQILGTRVPLNRNKYRLVLVPREGAGRPLKISTMFALDDAFQAWLASVPDLDQRDQQQVLSEVASDTNLGATPDERLAALESAKRTARVINTLAVVLGLWGFIYPRPYGLAIAILIWAPFLALALVAASKGILRLQTTRADPRPNVILAVIVPAVALTMRTLTTVYVVQWAGAAWLAIGVGAVLWFAAIKADPNLVNRRAGALVFAPFALVYGYGAGLEANAALDRSPVSTYEAIISAKYISHGRSTSYHLQLDPWGPNQAGSRIQVSRAVYEALNQGDAVSLALRKGAFGVPWYTVQSYGGLNARVP